MTIEELGLKTVKEVMVEYPTLDKDYSLSEVLKLMERNKIDRIVLTEDGIVRGIVTLKDILLKLGTVRTRQAAPSALHASSFMTEPVVSAPPDSTLHKIASEMDRGGFTSVPVVEDGEPIGLVTRFEIARELSELPSASDITVRSVMRTPQVSVGLHTRILHARQLIQQYDISVIPVLESGKLVGVIGVDELSTILLKYYELSRETPKRVTPLKYITVGDIVKQRPPRINVDSSLAEAAELMVRSRYRAVIVEDAGRPVGIVSGLELARAIIRM